ncbi:MAG: energy-coupling factor transporter ATPase [Clostridiales bacterium]|nr:energy-coupling factor transporter ATPase [Clostridiales bacterium]
MNQENSNSAGTVELRGVSYIYGRGTPFEKKAIDNINLTFEPGCITGLIGHTGSGKSTLVQLLNGLLKPDEGRILVDGVDIWDEPKKQNKLRFKVGLVFQYPEYQLFEETVRRDIAYGPSNMKLSGEEIERRVVESAKFCGLDEELLDKSPFELSGGQRRRAAIAGVIAMEPRVLILDEPTAGLDPMGREDILGGMRSYQRARNSTVIIVSHSMEDMARYSDRIVVMKNGRVEASGGRTEVFSRSDMLIGAGLDVPQITRLWEILKGRGIELPDDVFTVERACEVLLDLLRTDLQTVKGR